MRERVHVSEFVCSWLQPMQYACQDSNFAKWHHWMVLMLTAYFAPNQDCMA